ncbi:phosphoserine aminotransferase [Thelephora terrestris]|uniref:phosphoserine transaminase n=1 Tax=Thelephora terrestris TaxID=56493 RepID=A0A9P6LCI2_9AGAM|nr:phosphoserine aminotransferase [Thelephora terrestris]
MSQDRAVNFGAGPSALPLFALQEAATNLLNFQNTGIGIAEISHRAKEFTGYLAELEARIRKQLDVPPTHKIIFTQGGGTGQFSAVVYNLLARHRLLYPDLADDERRLEYVLTGNWSLKAVEEARRLCTGPRGVGGDVKVVVDARTFSKDGKSFDNIPPHAEYQFSPYTTSSLVHLRTRPPPPALIYYCENETVHGVQFSEDLKSPQSFPFGLLFPPDSDNEEGGGNQPLLPLVGDYSSSFMSRPIPRLADHAVIFAGAQKNLGPAGLTIVIVRQDCLVDAEAAAKLGAAPIPVTLAYKTIADSNSVYNTPSVFAIYVAGLVVENIEKEGGLAHYEQVNRRKKEKLYGVLKEGEEAGVLRRKVQEGSESWMNVVWEVLGQDGLVSKELEQKFLDGATQRGMLSLKGYRSLGGIRASIYNAVTESDVERLVAYIEEFTQAEKEARV